MQDWHPRATRIGPGTSYPASYIGVAWKIVLHTTESSGYSPSADSFFGTSSWPHATISEAGIWQHIPISHPARALYHGGPEETNNANAVQCEIVTFAADAPNMSDALLANVADWVGWVADQTGVDPSHSASFHGPNDGIVIASEDSPIRLRGQDWYDFAGVCGHQHVPSGNDHWDPGAFPMQRLLTLISGPTPNPQPDPQPSEELDDMPCTFNFDNFIWAYGDNRLIRLTHPDQATAHRDSGAKDLGDRSEPVHQFYSALAGPENVIVLQQQ